MSPYFDSQFMGCMAAADQLYHLNCSLLKFNKRKLLQISNKLKSSIIVFSEQIDIVSVRKRSCGKVMFLHLSVILFTGGRCTSLRHPPPETTTAADGTHPTGMHSYYEKFQAISDHGEKRQIFRILFLENDQFTQIIIVFSSFDVFEIFLQKNEQYKPSVLQKATS